MWSITSSVGPFGRGYTGIACGSLETSEFPRSEVAGAIPSLYCGSVFESDMCINSASATYNGLWSYGDTRYKTAV
jgi:hypothetical protein